MKSGSGFRRHHCMKRLLQCREMARDDGGGSASGLLSLWPGALWQQTKSRSAIPLTMLRTVPRKWRTQMSDQPLYRPQDDRPVTQASADATAREIARMRDLRLDLFRDIALFLMFIDHIPGNVLCWRAVDANWPITDFQLTETEEAFIHGIRPLPVRIPTKKSGRHAARFARCPRPKPFCTACFLQHRSNQQARSGQPCREAASPIGQVCDLISWCY